MAHPNVSSLLQLVDSMKSMISTIETAPDDDVKAYFKLRAQISELGNMAEAPAEVAYRLMAQPYQTAAVEIADDLGIFGILLEKAGKGIDAAQLAERTGADELLTKRLMAMIVSLNLCTLNSSRQYIANGNTEAIIHTAWSRTANQVAGKLPQYFKSHGYRSPTDPANSPFAYTFGEEFWPYLRNHGILDRYNKLMSSGVGRMSIMPSLYPVQERLVQDLETGEDAVAFVDIGGNLGHEIIKLRERYPDLTGKLVLQDLPDVIARCNARELEGIKLMPHDFYELQPVKGARAYYLRSVLHDWPDEHCRRILKRLVDVMKPGYSKVLICEYVLLEKQPNLTTACFDLAMMSYVCAMERTMEQWEVLLRSVGLRITDVVQMVPGGEGVIEAVLEG